MTGARSWRPLAAENLKQIRERFAVIFPAGQYGNLAERIAEYWSAMLERVWREKDPRIKQRDLAYRPDDPLSRIEQRTLVIAYADSIQQPGQATLATLNDFLTRFFPALRGVHMLPACVVVEDRFNDGYFAQVQRNRVHERFGGNDDFSDLMRRRFSMADFVLNHVDIGNPRFQAYLNGEEAAGRCFFVMGEAEYQRRAEEGDFARVFRPRPFPLFTIFRRRPRDPRIAAMSLEQRVAEMRQTLGRSAPPPAVLGILYLFNKLRNDQMLLEEDYGHLARFREYLKGNTHADPESLFAVSETQEVRHVPYIFKSHIDSRAAVLRAIGLDAGIAPLYERHDSEVFGEEIRALTTFSHVQVDLNTGTFEGLQMLADDFSWYLSMDINLLRLDAANYAFKKWKSSCFGLPEVTHMMKILYLSMDSVSPRIVPNLEVNDQLGVILKQMADPEAPPPMMYDFHLAGILPLVFTTASTSALPRIFELVESYDIPRTSIRFSLAESHDGKSVRGSMDLLTREQRRALTEVVEANGGRIKYKSVPGGREPYELCCSTRDSLPRLSGKRLEIERYLSFYTLAFALMGRNVKAVYFNDLMALPNDHKRYERSGELRDLKRTKSDYKRVADRFADPESFERRVARGMNNLIALVDSDPAMHYRGGEAKVVRPVRESSPESVAVISCACGEDHSLIVVNVSDRIQSIVLDAAALKPPALKPAVSEPASAAPAAPAMLYDNLNGREIVLNQEATLDLALEPFARMWLSPTRIEVDAGLMVSAV